jgi:hypothetical protein
MSNLRRRPVLYCALAVLLGTTAAACCWPRERSLLAVSKRVPGTQTFLRFEQRTYAWNSDHEVLVQAGPHMPSCFGNRRPDSPAFQTAVVDRQTGRSTLLTNLDAKLNATKTNWGFPPLVRFAPQARRALKITAGFPSKLEVISFEGERWPVEQGPEGAFEWLLPDGERWAALDWDRLGVKATIRAVRYDQNVRTRSETIRIPTSGTAADALAHARIIGAVPRDRVFFIRAHKETLEYEPAIVVVDLRRRTSKAYPIVSCWPRAAKISAVQVCCCGQHLAWLLHVEGQWPRSDPWSKLRRILGIQQQTADYLAVYTSHSDGSNMHERGILSLASQGGNEIQWLEELQWVPGCKELSYVYRDALWTVPAE